MTGAEVLRLVAVGFAVPMFYSVVAKRGGDRSIVVVRVGMRGGLGSRYTTAELDALARLAIVAALQFAFCVALLQAVPATVSQLTGRLEPGLVLLGAALGVGEYALAAFLCYTAIQFALL